uniref:cobaltochelatase subunit CobN n=1 Tax=Desertibaculum subflavum TaxID=2268458 RepID=UPI0034D1C28D
DLDRSPAAERRALLDALDGRFVPPGPAGAPSRGRADVLPTGRNLYSVDPRAVPTRSALVLARRAAEELLRRHVQEHGSWPESVVIDLWGSTAMRTGGEDLALALVLLGVAPVWDTGSNRVTGVEAVPAVELGRPRVDVTLRISGLFRDAFPQLIALFDQAVRMVARLPEAVESNPLAAAGQLEGEAFRQATTRIYGAPAGTYGSPITALIDRGAWQERDELGLAHLQASSGAFGLGLEGTPDAVGLSARLAGADMMVSMQDHAEIDLLEGTEAAAHRGGLAAAAEGLGANPALYHLDTSMPDAPRARTVAEEVARVVRGRIANPAWLAGMMRHGYRGGAEIARAVDGLFACAATLPVRFDRQFDLVYEATLADPAVDAFLRASNPDARTGMQRRFAEALHRGLWRPRRNAVAAELPTWAA